MPNLIRKLVREEIEKRNIQEVSNTLGADVNEILMGVYLLGGTWNGFVNAKEAKAALNQRKGQISPEEYADQDGRAKVMAEEVVVWASSNGFNGKPAKVWWTARPGILGKAVGQEVDSRKNPTDTLIQFTDGSFLGVSAKSTKGKGEIAFKNLGIGSLGKAIGVDLIGSVSKTIESAIRRLKLPAKSNERKQFIRANPEIQKKTRAIGIKTLSELRDTLFNAYKETFNNEQMAHHIRTAWMDSTEAFPYYIKATGGGKNGNYVAKITDPLNNDKLKALSEDRVSITPTGNASILVHTGNQKIMKIRWKWESEPLASGIKLSGDPA